VQQAMVAKGLNEVVPLKATFPDTPSQRVLDMIRMIRELSAARDSAQTAAGHLAAVAAALEKGLGAQMGAMVAHTWRTFTPASARLGAGCTAISHFAIPKDLCADKEEQSRFKFDLFHAIARVILQDLQDPDVSVLTVADVGVLSRVCSMKTPFACDAADAKYIAGMFNKFEDTLLPDVFAPDDPEVTISGLAFTIPVVMGEPLWNEWAFDGGGSHAPEEFFCIMFARLAAKLQIKACQSVVVQLSSQGQSNCGMKAVQLDNAETIGAYCVHVTIGQLTDSRTHQENQLLSLIARRSRPCLPLGGGANCASVVDLESAEQKEDRQRACQDLLVKTMIELGHGSDPRQWSFKATICEALEEQGIE